MKEYGFSVATVGLATAVCFVLFPLFDPTNLAMIYLLGALGVAVRGRRGPVILASVLSVMCFDFFFIPPRFTLRVADPQSLWTFGVLFATVMVTSHLTLRDRKSVV